MSVVTRGVGTRGVGSHECIRVYKCVLKLLYLLYCRLLYLLYCTLYSTSSGEVSVVTSAPSSTSVSYTIISTLFIYFTQYLEWGGVCCHERTRYFERAFTPFQTYKRLESRD